MCKRFLFKIVSKLFFILTDDQGSIDVNSYGVKDLVTPNINYITENGVSFTQFFASPVCSPSRAALLTGKTCQNPSNP